MDMYGDLESKEDQFHLDQTKVRALIRVKEGRAKPIDILAMSMNLDNPDGDMSYEEPYNIFNASALLSLLSFPPILTFPPPRIR